MDLYSTFVALGGAELPEDHEVDGLDMMAFLEGKEPSPRRELFFLRGRRLEGVRVGNWKMRVSSETDRRTAVMGELTPELFDLANDPSERYNMMDRQPGKAEELKARMDDFGAAIPSRD